MSWNQFHFKCRFLLQEINSGSTLQQANQSFTGSKLGALYSDEKLSGIQKSLLDGVFKLSSIKDIRHALRVYSSLDLSRSCGSSEAFTGIISKLTSLQITTAVFVVFITIYKFFVYPTFYDLAAQYPSLSNATFSSIPLIWLIGVAISMLTIALTIFLIKFIKNIDAMIVKSPHRAAVVFMPKKAVDEIVTLNRIINLPIKRVKNNHDFDEKYSALIDSDLDESIELTALFNHHSEKLELILTQYAKPILALMNVLITLGIAFYIIQIYDPIFSLGATVQ